ncbi:MAG: hypothetical protein HQK54_05180 [Oligoflexales bacterium]|nr:hypothetical protein [Oligoflexales bacterium]
MKRVSFVKMLGFALMFLPGCGENGAKEQSGQHHSVKTALSRVEWLSHISYRSKEEVPLKASEGCEILNFIVAMPAFPPSPGHSAISIGRRFRDFGARISDWEEEIIWNVLYNKSNAIVDFEGSPWWGEYSRVRHGRRIWDPDKFRSYDDIDLPSVINNLESLAEADGDFTFLLIPMEVDASHAKRVSAFWDYIYAERPRYQVPGLHCTSSVIRSFHETEIEPGSESERKPGSKVWFPEIMLPQVFAEKLLDHHWLSWNYPLGYRHRCGDRKGEPLKAAVLRVDKEVRKHGGDRFLIGIDSDLIDELKKQRF